MSYTKKGYLNQKRPHCSLFRKAFQISSNYYFFYVIYTSKLVYTLTQSLSSTFICQGCSRDYKSRIGLYSHTRRCSLINPHGTIP